MKALMNFNSPVGQVFSAMTLLFLPYAAKVNHQDGLKGSQRLVWKLCALYAGGTCLYWIAILSLREPLVHHLYAGKYTEVTSLLPWVALGSVFRMAATAQALTLRATNSVARLFFAYSVSGVAALVVGIPSVWAFGLHGAVATFVFSGAVAFILSLVMVQRSCPVAAAA
jgi:O-antigen/teichoic acid export membrane protein